MKKLTVFMLATALAGCSSTLGGRPPALSSAEKPVTPTVDGSLAQWSEQSRRGQAAAPAQQTSASLFRSGASGFFRDQRASHIGDVVTIKINISDNATLGNSTTRSRTGSESSGIAGLLGLQTLLPSSINPGKLVDTSSSSKNAGQGNIARSESVNMTMAAIVSDVLPNGNLMIKGRQEVRVNGELRELVVTGIIRPEDIARDNSILHSQIAEARISYGGRGQLSDAQKARWGQQIFDALFPF